MEATRIEHAPFSNRLSDAEIERLAILAEECGEVVQMVGKILRHGYESVHPRDVMKVTNHSNLEKEVSNVAVIIQMMVDAGDMNVTQLTMNMIEQKKTIGKYLHHQERK